MADRVMFDDQYYADQSHAEAPWLIRNGEHRVVGHYTQEAGVNWGGLMREADKEWLFGLVKLKLNTPAKP
ncbi:MAG: hypothetical protein ABI824_11060 [Acidobacteriota bacterium]